MSVGWDTSDTRLNYVTMRIYEELLSRAIGAPSNTALPSCSAFPLFVFQFAATGFAGRARHKSRATMLQTYSIAFVVTFFKTLGTVHGIPVAPEKMLDQQDNPPGQKQATSSTTFVSGSRLRAQLPTTNWFGRHTPYSRSSLGP